jgi:hypothetical protein
MIYRVIDLGSGHQALIDDADWPLVAGLRLYRDANGYVRYSTYDPATQKTKHFYLHRLFMQTPKGMHTDHINHDKLDNRRSNLRVVTPSINQRNRRDMRARGRSGVVGVRFHRGRWEARISIDGEHRHLGRFDTLEEAAAARRLAEEQIAADIAATEPASAAA